MSVVHIVDAPTEAQIRTAIETTAVDGDTVVFDGGCNITLSTNPLRIINKSIRIVGNGAKTILIGQTNGDIFQWTNPAAGASLSGLEISNFRLIGQGALGSGVGVNVIGSAGQGNLINVLLDRLTISNCYDGVAFTMPDVTNFNRGANVVMNLCEITNNRHFGATLTNVLFPRISSCNFEQNAQVGLSLVNCVNAHLASVAVKGNNTQFIAPGANFEGGAQALIKNCNGFQVSGYYLEMSTLSALASARSGLVISGCSSGHLSGLTFNSNDASDFFPQTYGVRLVNGSRGIRIGSIAHSYITTPIAWEKNCEPPIYDEASVIQVLPSDLLARGLF